MTNDFDTLVAGAERGGTDFRGIAILALLLCFVFFLAVGAYGYFAAGEEQDGEIPGAIAVLRDFVTENETVAVFLGFDVFSQESVQTSGEGDSAYEARVKEKAVAYIEEKQGGRS